MNMARTFTVVIQQDADGWFVGSVAEIPGCHTQARSLDELLSRVREAIELCLEDDCDGSTQSSFVGVHSITI
jgi:predicted RNase H-like HicB family nuclease